MHNPGLMYGLDTVQQVSQHFAQGLDLTPSGISRPAAMTTESTRRCPRLGAAPLWPPRQTKHRSARRCSPSSRLAAGCCTTLLMRLHRCAAPLQRWTGKVGRRWCMQESLLKCIAQCLQACALSCGMNSHAHDRLPQIIMASCTTSAPYVIAVALGLCWYMD